MPDRDTNERPGATPAPSRAKGWVGALNANTTIRTKGLLLVAVPLTFQVVFLALVLAIQWQVADAQEWALHTKIVLSKVDAFYRHLVEGRAGLREMVLSRDAGRYMEPRRLMSTVETEAADLERETSDNALQIPRTAEMRRTTTGLIAWHRDVALLVRDGRFDEAMGRLNDGDGPALMESMRGQVDRFRGEEEGLDVLRIGRLRSQSGRQVALMIAGASASLAGTLALLALFGRDLARRFSILTENARRLGEGQELSSPIVGRDEIADLDLAFHRMARSLDEKSREVEMFIYSVSHDLRSPLVNLQGFSQELGYASRDLAKLFDDPAVPAPIATKGRALVESEVAESIKFIQTAVSRLSVIIDALLRLSRAGRVEYRFGPVDVGATVRRGDRFARPDDRGAVGLGDGRPAADGLGRPDGDRAGLRQPRRQRRELPRPVEAGAGRDRRRRRRSPLERPGSGGRTMSGTTGWGSPRRGSPRCSWPSSGSTRGGRGARGSAWRWSARSSSGTAGGSGSSRPRASAAPSTSTSPPRRKAGRNPDPTGAGPGRSRP